MNGLPLALHAFRSLVLTVIDYVIPPREWRVPVLVTFAVMGGLALTILHISRATSYLSDRPEVCMNCHVMSTAYSTWQHSNHRYAATCVDCHVPHDNIIHKYLFKAQDGLRHSFMFTFRLEPQSMRIGSAGTAAVQENCKRCHENLTHWTALRDSTGKGARHGDNRLCWDCHRETPHQRRFGIAAAPYARIPKLPDVVPNWLDALMLKEHKRPQ